MSGAETGVLPAINEAIFALAFLPGSDGIAAKDDLIKARDAVAEMIKAAESVQRQVAPLLSSNGYRYVGAMESLRKALARVDGAA